MDEWLNWAEPPAAVRLPSGFPLVRMAVVLHAAKQTRPQDAVRVGSGALETASGTTEEKLRMCSQHHRQHILVYAHRPGDSLTIKVSATSC